MRTPVALLPCLVALCWGATPKKCPKSELAEIEYSVRTCQKQAEARFFISPDSLRLCQLLVEVVDTCTKGYALCHSDVKILVLRRAQKRVYTDKMMKMYGIGELILNCTVPGVDDSSLIKSVQPKTHKYTTTKRCPTERAVRESVRAYKECADAANDAMESRFRTSDSSLETQKPIICETVDELLTTCFDLMTRCMDSDEEIRDLRERQGDLLATLFYRLTYTIGFSIKQCPGFGDSRTLPTGKEVQSGSESPAISVLLIVTTAIMTHFHNLAT